MVNTTYCDVCNHEYKHYKKHLQTNKHTFNLFHQISPLELERKHCDICSKDVLKSSYKNHLQSQNQDVHHTASFACYCKDTVTFTRVFQSHQFHFGTQISETVDESLSFGFFLLVKWFSSCPHENTICLDDIGLKSLG